MLKAFLKRPMKGYNFTERVRKSLARARDEAERFHHEYIGTEHILLGLLRDDDGVAVTVIHHLRVEPSEIADKIEDVVKRGRPGAVTGPDLPYTSRAKKVLELAMEEARDLGHAYVGTEHFLLGLIREQRGIAAQVLTDSGITYDRARDEVCRVLGTAVDHQAAPARHRSGVASMKVWTDREGFPASTSMAASIIELMARDTGIEAVFAEQGIDVATLVAALRSFTPPAPPEA